MNYHRSAPQWFKDLVFALVSIRTLEHGSILGAIPNELLFLIFGNIDCRPSEWDSPAPTAAISSDAISPRVIIV